MLGDKMGWIRTMARCIRLKIIRFRLTVLFALTVLLGAAICVGVVSLNGVDATIRPTNSVVTLPGTRCAMFPADNVWNTDISKLPVSPQSASWLSAIDNGNASIDLHPDFGPGGGARSPYGIAYTIISPTQRFVHVNFAYSSESDPGPYPFGPNTPIEGGAQSTGDRHALMVDPKTCVLYELYDAHFGPNGTSTAGSGAIWRLGSNRLRKAGWTSADAAGLLEQDHVVLLVQIIARGEPGDPAADDGNPQSVVLGEGKQFLH